MTYNDKKLLGEAYTLTQFNPSDKDFLVFKNVDGNTLKYEYPDLPVGISRTDEWSDYYKTYIPLYIKKVKEVVSENTFFEFKKFINRYNDSGALYYTFNSPQADTEDFAKIEKIRNNILKLYNKNNPYSIDNIQNYPCVISMFGQEKSNTMVLYYLKSLTVYNKKDIKKKYQELLNTFEKVMSKTDDFSLCRLMGHKFEIKITLNFSAKHVTIHHDLYTIVNLTDVFKEEEEKLNDNIL